MLFRIADSPKKIAPQSTEIGAQSRRGKAGILL
jgi:hypothetical protein